jgi:hypothetical protein
VHKSAEVKEMALETKVILKMIFDIVRMSKTKKEALERIAEYANVEGVIQNLEVLKDDSFWGE